MVAADEAAEIVAFEAAAPAVVQAVERLLDRVEVATGAPPLSEASRLAWTNGEGHFRGFVARAGNDVVGYVHAGWRGRSWTIEMALDPAGDPTVREALLRAAVDVADDGGASEIRLWDIAHRAEDPVVTELGFAVERDLFQMRVPLPLAGERGPLPEGLTLRTFVPGQDEERWLEVNNRAFATHPEQGHWELEDVVARERAPWFDPSGFLLCEDGEQLAASCWTKVHADHDPPLGEIYVISVNPDFQGLGLGRLLTVAGLDWLAERVDDGMLYVDSTNAAAVSLYRSLGFETHHVDRCYLRRAGR